MTSAFRIDTATSAPETTLFDMLEVILGNPATAQSIIRFRRGSMPSSNLTLNGLWTGGGNAGRLGETLNGDLWRRAFGAAFQTATMRVAEGLNHPMGEDVTTDPPGYVRPERWTMQTVMHQAAIIGQAPCAMSVASNQSALNFTTGNGFEVSSELAIFGGNWAVLRRNAVAGALVTVDTGIPGLTDVLAEIIYENTTNPQLFARVNGVEFGRVSGLANIPTRADAIAGSASVWELQNIGGSGSAVAVWSMFFRGWRLIIEELVGFV